MKPCLPRRRERAWTRAAILAALCCATVPSRAGTAAVTRILCVTGTIAVVRIPDANVGAAVGDRMPLFQDDEHGVVGLAVDQDGSRLAFFPKVKGRSPVWSTADKIMVFGTPSRSAEGALRLEAGEKLEVIREEADAWIARLERHDRAAELRVPLGHPGFVLEEELLSPPPPAPPPTDHAPAPEPPAPEEVVRRHTIRMEGPKEDSPAPEPSGGLDRVKALALYLTAALNERRTFVLLGGLPVLFLLLAAGLLLRRRGVALPPPANASSGSSAALPAADSLDGFRPVPPPPAPISAAPRVHVPITPPSTATMVLPQGTLSAAEQGVAADAESLGKYSLQRLIGQGSMGIVYRAHQEDLDRTVALKLLRDGVHADDRQRKRFLREARTAAKLRHPNIITVYEVGEVDRQPFFAMDFIEGETLDRVIEKAPPRPIEAARLCRQIAEAVHYAHQQGVIHRDLKPANIILQPGGAPVVTDFGLARHTDDAQLSMAGDIVGTPSFMSPEQARGRAEDVDARTDVYALGAILYALLAQRNPLDRGSLIETLNAVLHEEPPPLKTIAPEVDPALAAICERAMAKTREDRFQTAGDLAAALSDYIEEHLA